MNTLYTYLKLRRKGMESIHYVMTLVLVLMILAVLYQFLSTGLDAGSDTLLDMISSSEPEDLEEQIGE